MVPVASAVMTTLSVGEVAAEAGVAPSAVRFYEQHGLVTAERTPGNQRRFTTSAPCVIRVAKVAQRVGLTVREISDRLGALPADPSPQDWRQLTEDLVTEAERRVAELQALLTELGSPTKLCERQPA